MKPRMNRRLPQGVGTVTCSQCANECHNTSADEETKLGLPSGDQPLSVRACRCPVLFTKRDASQHDVTRTGINYPRPTGELIEPQNASDSNVSGNAGATHDLVVTKKRCRRSSAPRWFAALKRENVGPCQRRSQSEQSQRPPSNRPASTIPWQLIFAQ